MSCYHATWHTVLITRTLLRLLLLCVLAGASLALAGANLALPRRIAVLTPTPVGPYGAVYEQIKGGIASQAQGRALWLSVEEVGDHQLSSILKRHEVQTVIAVGRKGLLAAASLDRDIRVIGGGVTGLPEGYSRPTTVLSLVPDPIFLFAQLKAMVPTVRRLVVIYNPHKSGWFITPAVEAATAFGLTLVPLEADDLKTAMRLYQDFFNGADGKRDALWLPLDSTTVSDEVVLPYVLMESWTRRVAVISNNAYHAKLGTLVALYPNSYDVGQTLWSLAFAADNTSSKGLITLRTAKMAFNRRTASHLGIAVTATLENDASLIFPSM